MNNPFATAINCMDGRVQIPVIEFLKDEYRVGYVDMITEPGPNKILAGNEDEALVESIKRRVAISVEKHHSKLIAIVGHHDCAGNPTEKKAQLNQITASINTIESWGFNAQVIGLWIDENWGVENTKEV